MLDIKSLLLELLHEEQLSGNDIIEYMQCTKCNIPFLTEDGSDKCVVCSGRMTLLHEVKMARCPICGNEFDSGNKTTCSKRCTVKALKLGIKRKERRDMIDRGFVMDFNKAKRLYPKNQWSGKQHPWKSGQRGSYGNM